MTDRHRYYPRGLPSGFRVYDANSAEDWVDLYRIHPNGREEWINDFASVDWAVAAALIIARGEQIKGITT